MIMAKNSRPAGRCATATATALRVLVICFLALVVPTDVMRQVEFREVATMLYSNVYDESPNIKTNVKTNIDTTLIGEEKKQFKEGSAIINIIAEGTMEFYFSEFLAESDEPLVLLDEGPFKLTASCRTISYSFSDWQSYYSSYYYSSSYYYGSYGSSSSSSNWTSSTSSDSTYTGSYYYDDDYYFGDDYWYYGTYNESIAALELTYTADDSDYLFGSPTWVRYPYEKKVVGSYEAGENRTQIVLAGYDGGWSGECTLQSLSGAYFSTNGASTIGFHTTNDRYHGTPEDYSYPAGVDCMMAGVISYFVPSSASS